MIQYDENKKNVGRLLQRFAFDSAFYILSISWNQVIRVGARVILGWFLGPGVGIVVQNLQPVMDVLQRVYPRRKSAILCESGHLPGKRRSDLEST